MFGSATEAFSQKNIACSVEESLERFRKVLDAAKYVGVKVRGYVGVARSPFRDLSWFRGRRGCLCLVQYGFVVRSRANGRQ